MAWQLPFQGFLDEGENAGHVVRGHTLEQPTEQAEPGERIGQIRLVAGGFFVWQGLVCAGQSNASARFLRRRWE
ncbi:hypothetical protein [Methyloglobulus sp.]|uniref:hypothetical protein n=1 Tax=Methyloglobulus sp. TaxID=2518622 RepID=UPI003989DE61